MGMSRRHTDASIEFKYLQSGHLPLAVETTGARLDVIDYDYWKTKATWSSFDPLTFIRVSQTMSLTRR